MNALKRWITYNDVIHRPLKWVDPVANPMNTNKYFFPYIAVRLGHFIHNEFSICNKHASLTAKIGKQRKIKFL